MKQVKRKKKGKEVKGKLQRYTLRKRGKMNKTCARCEKTVYPIEELKCLDKVGVMNLHTYCLCSIFFLIL